MPRKVDEWASRIKEVEREYKAVRLATDRLLRDFSLDTDVTRAGMQHRDILNASARLEGTYVVRLFAEFETGLRLCWQEVRGKRPPSRTEDLVNGMASYRRIPSDLIADIHAVRTYRNRLIHEREAAGDPIPIGKARGSLCSFLGYLPPNW
jgi:hypothetical protein